MKRRDVSLLILPLIILSGCNPNNSNNTAPSEQRLATLLNNIDVNKVVSFDFEDRSYDFDTYNNSKYIITGNIKKAVVNYRANHNFKLFNDNVTDDIVVYPLVGVEEPTMPSDATSTEAKGQIYTTSDGYLFDYLVCDSEPSQSYVNCYEIDYFNNLDTYFNYLNIINMAFEAFSDYDSYFSEEDGYTPADISIDSKGDMEIYHLGSSFPGSATYKPYLISFDIEYNNKTNSFEKISYTERSMLNTVEGDLETETDSLRIWTISNMNFGDKQNFTGDKYNFDNITNKDNIHDAPNKIVDVSNKENGSLDDQTTLSIIQNIYAYTRNVRQTNYSMYFHNAFDIANTNSIIGDAIFEGKITAYKNNITDNVGKIQKVNKDGLPTSEAPANYRILTEIVDEEGYQGVLRTGKFDKYMTSCLAFALKSTFVSSRTYLDPNPLYWNEISSILADFTDYKLGNNVIDSSTNVQISVSGIKNDNSLTIIGQRHKTTYFVEYIDVFTFNIENNVLTSCKFEATGKKYTDVYEAKFVYGEKTNFTGEKISDDITTQVEMSAFNII